MCSSISKYFHNSSGTPAVFLDTQIVNQTIRSLIQPS